MDVPEHVTHLFKHLVQGGFIEPIENVHREYMGIFSRAILTKIRNRDQSWEKMVPPRSGRGDQEGLLFRV